MITKGVHRSNRPFYNMAEFVCDFETDVANLPTDVGVGSTARVIENGNVYILNSQHQWILQPKNGGGGTPDYNDTIIYDGGVIS